MSTFIIVSAVLALVFGVLSVPVVIWTNSVLAPVAFSFTGTLIVHAIVGACGYYK
jgi:hypothetical protein